MTPFAIVPVDATEVMVSKAYGYSDLVLADRDEAGVPESVSREMRLVHKTLISYRPASCRDLEAAIFGEGGLVEAAKARLEHGHNDTCSEMLTSDHEYACSCGHSAQRDALARVQKLMGE